MIVKIAPINRARDMLKGGKETYGTVYKRAFILATSPRAPPPSFFFSCTDQTKNGKQYIARILGSSKRKGYAILNLFY